LPNWNSGDEKGKQDYLSLRVGHDFANWQGVQDDPDPSTIPPGALAVGENIRIRARGKFISERPGVTQLNSTAMNGGAAIVGIYDERVWAGNAGDGLSSGRGVRLLTAAVTIPKTFEGQTYEGFYTPGETTYGHGSIGAVDESLSAVTQEVCRGSASRVYGPMFMDQDGTVYCGLQELESGSYVPYLASFKPTPVATRTDSLVSLQAAPAKLCRIPMSVLGTEPYYHSITSITRVGPYIFVGVTGYNNSSVALAGSPSGGSAAVVYRWDGKTLTSDHSVAAVDGSFRILRTLLFPYGEILVASFFQAITYNQSTHELFKARAADGTWATITNSMTPAYDATHAHPLQRQNDSKVYKDHLYIAGGSTYLNSSDIGGRIAKYDRTSLTNARDVVDDRMVADGLGGVHAGVVGLAVVGEYLYYLHTQFRTSTGYVTYLGRYDGSSWTDKYATLYNSGGSPSGVQYMGVALVRQNGKLYAVLQIPLGGSGVGGKIMGASESDLSTWNTVETPTTVYGWPASNINNNNTTGWVAPV
jgi:hypothetical protein